MVDVNFRISYYIDREKIEEKKPVYGEIVVTPPTIKNGGIYADAGIDLFAAYEFIVAPHSMKVIDTFVGFALEVGVAGLIWPRSGDDFLVGAGVIDTGYTGTIKVKIINIFDHEMKFSPGDSVGQLVLFRKGVMTFPELVEYTRVNTANLNVAIRGDDGRINSQI